MLHANITARRTALKLSKAELARRCEVSNATVTNWEAGTVPRPAALERLAQVLETTVAELYAS